MSNFQKLAGIENAARVANLAEKQDLHSLSIGIKAMASSRYGDLKEDDKPKTHNGWLEVSRDVSKLFPPPEKQLDALLQGKIKETQLFGNQPKLENTTPEDQAKIEAARKVLSDKITGQSPEVVKNVLGAFDRKVQEQTQTGAGLNLATPQSKSIAPSQEPDTSPRKGHSR